ncbi:MAG TPA: peptidoglycan glycosyltransferase [Bacteroidales bacterium]|nr:peptidoglycan glycosyltransferase [Bacteroidales bacterium]
MALRDDIIWRSGVMYIIMLIIAFGILARIIIIQYVEGDKWAELGEEFVYKTDIVPANRGDILSDDGRLLASSVPYYSVYVDTRSTGMEQNTWVQGIDGLCDGLSRIVGLKSAAEWKRDLARARRKGERYYLIKRRVSHNTLKELKKLPVFEKGRYKGGFIAENENIRIRPHLRLASRTIGYLTKGRAGNVVGLEGAYDAELTGISGSVLKQRLTGGAWMPVNNENSVEPRDGNDILTTINIDLQDVAETALGKQLIKHNAHHGVVVLMEVKTGDIKAITNLEIGDDGNYYESYNYAVGESTEPGSTFKLASFMAALEDGLIQLDDTIDTGDGKVRYYDKTIRDTRRKGYGKLSVREVFEKSSNVGTAKIIYENYKSRPGDYVDRLYRMGLNEKLGIDIKGEGIPLIRYPGDKYWSGISLPMMSHGYEVQLTPLQILTFYNAVANEGRMVKPRIVKEVQYHGETIKKVNVEVLNPAICSRSTIEKVKVLLEGVVKNGTAKNLNNDTYKIAGKTGTAQIANDKYGYKHGGKVSYQASFVGYFPADKPVYSCMVVVNAPSNSVYYGNLVAGPVFKEIADKVYATQFFNEPGEPGHGFPKVKKGYGDDTKYLLAELGIDHQYNGMGEWVETNNDNEMLKLEEMELIENLVPNVIGMGLKDALFLLENSGLKVTVKGRGSVVRQSQRPGIRIQSGSTINIELSN